MSHPPDVSVVVPVYNDPEGLRKTLSSLTSQKNSPQFEVLVVDNDSTDETPKVVNEFESAYPELISGYSETTVQGSYAARNNGIKHSAGDVIAFLDADEVVGEDWLATAYDTMCNQHVDYLGCNVKLSLEDDTLVGEYNAQTGFPVEHYLKKENYAPTCALLVRREVFKAVGVFDGRLTSGGDIEFGQRVAATEYDQGYAADTIVTHPARTSVISLAKKNFRVGRGFCQKQRHYPKRYGRPGIPPKPSGSGSNQNEDEPNSVAIRMAFTILSTAMLACRGFGYYYEFLFGTE